MNLIASIFNLGGFDTVIILAVVLVIFGPKRLPELARGLRQALNEFHKAKDDVEREITRASDVVVQPAPGQQPRQPVELPPAQPPVAIDPLAQAPHPIAQVPHIAEETHPAGQV